MKMNSVPVIFNFPLWKGKIKRRVAKKYLTKWRQTWMMKNESLTHLGVGDFINDCSGFNGKISKLYPEYISVSKGFVLSDVDIDTGNRSCSLCNCGVEPKLSQIEIEKRIVEYHKEYTLTALGEHWYGKGSDKYNAAVDHANNVINHIESGHHITNDDGELLDEWRTK
jgi:hypothetical protein